MPQLVHALVDSKVVGVDAGYAHTVMVTKAGGVLTFGSGGLGHGTQWHTRDHGGAADGRCTCMQEGQSRECLQPLVTLLCGHHRGPVHMGDGPWPMGLGHRGPEHQLTLRLVEGVAGNNIMVVGAAAGDAYAMGRMGCAAAWTDAGELYTLIWRRAI